MTPGEAMENLGLIGSALDEMTPSIIRGAWAKAVKLAHTDTGGDYGLAPSQITTLTKARDLLLDHLSGSNRACKLCKGSGKVRSRFGTRDCIACKGTGDKL